MGIMFFILQIFIHCFYYSGFMVLEKNLILFIKRYLLYCVYLVLRFCIEYGRGTNFIIIMLIVAFSLLACCLLQARYPEYL